LLRHFDENSPTPQVEPEAFATKFANLHAALVLTGDFKISRLTSIGFQIRSVGETDTTRQGKSISRVLVTAFDLTSLDPGAAFGLGSDAAGAAADAAGSIDPLSFLGL
jgi:hypothetical protein